MKNVRSKRPYMAVVSAVWLVTSLPAARLAAELFGPKEDYTGFGAAGVALLALLISQIGGIIFGFFSLLRNERPRALSIFVILLNGAAISWLLGKILF
ncbi:MAG: hypothetical protein ABFS19_01265 [Thermodesulfobacteriota bacterium]